MSASKAAHQDYAQLISSFATSKAPSSAADNARALTAPIAQAWIQNKSSPDTAGFQSLWAGFPSLMKEPQGHEPHVQARAVELLAAIKAQGVLEDGGAICKTSLGTAWTELPWFGAEMREAWNDTPPELPADQWASLNAFAARVTAAGVSDFSLYAIWSLRETLEEARPFSTRDAGPGDSLPKTSVNVPVSELLPAAGQWLEHCGSDIFQWCQAGRSYNRGANAGTPARLGPLAQQASINGDGYSLERWAFWKSRFQEIAQIRDENGGVDKTSKRAYQVFELMNALEQKVQ